MSLWVIKTILVVISVCLNVLFQPSFFGKQIEEYVGAIPLRVKIYLVGCFILAATFSAVPDDKLIQLFNHIMLVFSAKVFVIAIFIGCLASPFLYRKKIATYFRNRRLEGYAKKGYAKMNALKFQKKIQKMFLEKGDFLFQQNLREHFIYLSFPQYVALVQEFVKYHISEDDNKEKAIFTGLCITPLQWFNYRIQSKGKKLFDIESINDLETCWADDHWLSYHNYLIRLRCSNHIRCQQPVSKCIEHLLEASTCMDYTENMSFKFYRHLLAVDDSITLRESHNFPRVSIIEKQLNELVIKKNDNAYIFSANELKNVESYKNIPSSEKAYLISDSGIDGEKLGQVFMTHFQKEIYCNVFYDATANKYRLTRPLTQTAYKRFSLNNLPEDFIMFGTMHEERLTSSFALGCDVSEDKVKLTLYGGSDPKLVVLDAVVNDDLLK